MAEHYAFGEFFRSAPLAAHDYSRSNGLSSLADEDEWGDFVKSPQLSHIADPPTHSFYGKENSPSHDLVSPPRWVKPSGALPLSIFGAVEEEEQEGKGPVDFNLERSNVGAVNHNSNLTASDSMSLSDGNLYSHTSLNKTENGPDSKSAERFDLIKNDSVVVDNGYHSNSDLNAARSYSGGSRKAHLDGSVGIADQTQFIQNGNSEFSFTANVVDTNQNCDPFGTWSLNLNGLSSFVKSGNTNVTTSGSNLDVNDHTRKLTAQAPSPAAADDDDDGWEFQDAFSEPQATDSSNKVDFTADDVFTMNTFSIGSVSSPSEMYNLFGPAKEYTDLFATSTKSVETVATSSAFSHGSQDVELIGVQPSKVSIDDSISEVNSKVKQSDTEDTSNPSPDVGSTDFDEDFGEFTAASVETNPQSVKDTNLNCHKSALPLSIFGGEEPESDCSVDAQDAFVHQSTSGSDNHTPKSAISISNLISSLYNETEKTSSLNASREPITVRPNHSSSMTRSNLGDDGVHNDASWDFKDAFSQMRDDNEASLRDMHLKTFKKKPNNHLDFYSELKEELCIVYKHHVGRLKQSQGNAGLLSEDAGLVGLTSEFQIICKELEQMGYHFEEYDKQDHALSNLSEFIEILLAPQFQILETEYHLSEKLPLVEKDLMAAMDLMKHTNAMLKILTLGTLEEKRAYVSVWYDVICVCAKELKEGALIWTQAAEKHVQSQLLAEPQGSDFVLALGEIYRVVVILAASAKLFKPWTISCSIDMSGIYILLEECHALWSTSGLEEILSSALVPTASMDALLFKSIKDIRGLDPLALQNYVFMEKDSTCKLSMLTARVAPGMKMIKWGEDQYFVTVANLWANLVSSNPPTLPRLLFGS